MHHGVVIIMIHTLLPKCLHGYNENDIEIQLATMYRQLRVRNNILNSAFEHALYRGALLSRRSQDLKAK